jgi:hypothetical protein
VQRHGGQPLVRDGETLEVRAGDFRFRDRDHNPTAEFSAVAFFEFYCPVAARYCALLRCNSGREPRWSVPEGTDLDHPTLTPSINCAGGCGWHGRVEKGEFKP